MASQSCIRRAHIFCTSYLQRHSQIPHFPAKSHSLCFPMSLTELQMQLVPISLEGWTFPAKVVLFSPTSLSVLRVDGKKKWRSVKHSGRYFKQSADSWYREWDHCFSEGGEGARMTLVAERCCLSTTRAAQQSLWTWRWHRLWQRSEFLPRWIYLYCFAHQRHPAKTKHSHCVCEAC